MHVKHKSGGCSRIAEQMTWADWLWAGMPICGVSASVSGFFQVRGTGCPTMDQKGPVQPSRPSPYTFSTVSPDRTFADTWIINSHCTGITWPRKRKPRGFLTASTVHHCIRMYSIHTQGTGVDVHTLFCTDPLSPWKSDTNDQVMMLPVEKGGNFFRIATIGIWTGYPIKGGTPATAEWSFFCLAQPELRQVFVLYAYWFWLLALGLKMFGED